MESTAVGDLLVTTCSTVVWRYDPKVEFTIGRGQMLIFLGMKRLPSSLNHLVVVEAVHPKHGTVECLACDLRNVENTRNIS